MIKLILISISFLLIQSNLMGQIRFANDTITGRNSELIDIELIVESENNFSEIEFDLQLSNPTVCYLVNIVEQNNILSQELLAKEDGLFSVKLSIRESIDNLVIKSKLLSGNDSTTSIRIFNLSIDSVEFVEDTATIKNIFFDGSGPYVRFLSSNSPYPNPIFSGGVETVEFYNDIDTDIHIRVCNSDGFIFIDEKKLYEKGKNFFEINTTNLSAGAYFISIYSQIGFSSQKFVVIK